MLHPFGPHHLREIENSNVVWGPSGIHQIAQVPGWSIKIGPGYEIGQTEQLVFFFDDETQCRTPNLLYII